MTPADWSWWVQPGEGWAAAPILIAVLAFLAGCAVLAARRSMAEAERLGEVYEAERTATRRREARHLVRRYLDMGYHPKAILEIASGGPVWTAAIREALIAEGATLPAAPPRGDP